MEVARCPVKSKNGFLGNNSKICCGNVCAVKSFACLAISLPRACSALPRLIVDASKPNTKAYTTPTIAAMVTVPIKRQK